MSVCFISSVVVWGPNWNQGLILTDIELTHNKRQYIPSKIHNRFQRKCTKGQRREVLVSQFNEQRTKAKRTQLISLWLLRKSTAGMRMTPAPYDTWWLDWQKKKICHIFPFIFLMELFIEVLCNSYMKAAIQIVKVVIG